MFPEALNAARLLLRPIRPMDSQAIFDAYGQDPHVTQFPGLRPGNIASARVMEKAGLTSEGVFHRWLVHPNIGDEPRDCIGYARVR